MKNEKGITLVALVIIICLLFIFSGAAIYTSIKSYKVIDIQKYKVQMQAIQSALDEFYEDFEADYEKNKIDLQNIPNDLDGDDEIDPNTEIIHIYEKEEYMDYYVEYIASSRTGSIIDLIKNMENNNAYSRKLNRFSDISPTNFCEWWKNIASSKFGITTGEVDISKQYYYMSKEEVEEILGVKDIDISENFIINFEKRYVFSEEYIEIADKDDNTTEEIYCLYQLNEEEKVVEFKINKTDGILDIDIIEKNLNYQIIKIKLSGTESKIKQVNVSLRDKIPTLETENDWKIENRKEYFSEITGYGTSEVCFKVIAEGEYNFSARDFLDGEYSATSEIKIVFHEPPVLDDDMIPFETVDENNGRIFLENRVNNLNDWYDYSKNKYATVVIANLTQNGGNLNEYNKNNAGKIFTINRYDQYVEDINKGTHIVKVWIPKKLWKENNNICSSLYNTDFINKTGVWVTAKWEGGKWVPDERLRLSTIVESFSKDKLTINLSTSISNMKYYWKLNDATDDKYMSTDTFTQIEGTNIQAKCNNGLLELKDNGADILQNIKSVSIYGIAPNGNKTTVKIVKAQKQEIDNNETGINLLNDGSFENSGSWEISCTGGNTDANLSYDTTIKRTGNSSLKLVKSKNHGEIAAKHKNNINVDYSHNYYFSAYSYQVTDTETAKTIEIFFPIVGGYSDSRSITKNIGKWQRHSWICKSRSYSSTNIGFRLDYDSPASSTTSTIYYDDAMLIDLDKLQDYINTNKINVTVSKNKEWCDTFIESEKGETKIYYYQ